MPKLQYKHEKGALHIGGGRIFFPGQPLYVTEEAKNALLSRFPDELEEVAMVETEEKSNKRSRKNPKEEEKVDADAGTAEKS